MESKKMGNAKVNRLGKDNRINTVVLPTTYIPSNWIRLIVKVDAGNRDIKRIKLETTPYLNTESVAINGLILSEGGSNDYTLEESYLILSDDIELFPGDFININYQF